MRRHRITVAGGSLDVCGEPERAVASIELAGERDASVELTIGQVQMTIEALAAVYAELCGGNPESVVRGVNRTIRNRTDAARSQRVAGRDS
jgi:poly(3-hydroxybutyrate) depolymerase